MWSILAGVLTGTFVTAILSWLTGWRFWDVFWPVQVFCLFFSLILGAVFWSFFPPRRREQAVRQYETRGETHIHYHVDAMSVHVHGNVERAKKKKVRRELIVRE